LGGSAGAAATGAALGRRSGGGGSRRSSLGGCSGSSRGSRFGSGARRRFGGGGFCGFTGGTLGFFALAAGFGQVFFLLADGFGLGARFFLAALQVEVFGARAGGSSTPAGVSSRLTKTRFLRTSTWIVRARPLASACLISVVVLRVSVIFLRSAPTTVPCEVRRKSSRRSLSASVSASSGDCLVTPAECSCSSSAVGRAA
jgi:hypothetical protein